MPDVDERLQCRPILPQSVKDQDLVERPGEQQGHQEEGPKRVPDTQRPVAHGLEGGAGTIPRACPEDDESQDRAESGRDRDQRDTPLDYEGRVPRERPGRPCPLCGVQRKDIEQCVDELNVQARR